LAKLPFPNVVFSTGIKGSSIRFIAWSLTSNPLSGHILPLVPFLSQPKRFAEHAKILDTEATKAFWPAYTLPIDQTNSSCTIIFCLQQKISSNLINSFNFPFTQLENCEHVNWYG
jgi:hypothetical protein